MELFNSSKNSPRRTNGPAGPYVDAATNLIYNLLFCDNPDLFKANISPPLTYPFDVLFSEASSVTDLQKIIDDNTADPRVRVLAYNLLRKNGFKPDRKELLAVIVEVGLEDGLDVLTAFNNGTARYINQTGKMLIWETTDSTSSQLTEDLFSKSTAIVNKIGPWDKPRRPAPTKGNVRITFLVSDGLYFGEGSMDVLFNDKMARPALNSATMLLKYLTEKSSENQN